MLLEVQRNYLGHPILNVNAHVISADDKMAVFDEYKRLKKPDKKGYVYLKKGDIITAYNEKDFFCHKIVCFTKKGALTSVGGMHFIDIIKHCS